VSPTVEFPDEEPVTARQDAVEAYFEHERITLPPPPGWPESEGVEPSVDDGWEGVP